MTNATKTLAALFVVLLVVAGFMKFSQSSSSSKELLDNVITVDTAKVNRITIHIPNKKTTVLSKKGKKWNVKQGNGDTYPANSSTIKNIITNVNQMKPVSIVTRNPRQYTRYEVDSTGTRVDFQNGNNNLASVYFGRFQMSGQRTPETYVRAANKKTVFLVNGFLSRNFSRNLDDWRNKQVWRYSQSNVTQVDMIYPADSSYTFVRGGSGNTWLYGTDTLKSGAVQMMLSTITRLNVDGFDNNEKPSDLTHPLYSIRIHIKGGETRELHLTPGAKDNKDNFLVTASDYPYVGKVRKSTYFDDVLKPLSQLKKHPKKKK